MRRVSPLLYISVFFLFIVSGCSAPEMTASYVNPEIDAELKYDKVYVSAIFNHDEGRKILEDELAHNFRENGVESTVSHELFPGPGTEFNQNRDMVYNKIDSEGNNGILMVSVLWEESNTRFVPSDGVYSPVVMNPYYQTYWNYYGHTGPMVYEPGYYTRTRSYFIEVNFYDVESEELVWSGQTESYSLADVENLSANIADLVVSELKDENLLSKKAETES